MTSIMTLTKAIADWQYCIEQEKTHSLKQKSTNNNADLSRILKQISRWKKELDQSFSEFGDLQETLANYNLYRQLDGLQKQIKTLL